MVSNYTHDTRTLQKPAPENGVDLWRRFLEHVSWTLRCFLRAGITDVTTPLIARDFEEMCLLEEKPHIPRSVLNRPSTSWSKAQLSL